MCPLDEWPDDEPLLSIAAETFLPPILKIYLRINLFRDIHVET